MASESKVERVDFESLFTELRLLKDDMTGIQQLLECLAEEAEMAQAVEETPVLHMKLTSHLVEALRQVEERRLDAGRIHAHLLPIRSAIVSEE